ncbi:hypothetical protein R4J17_06470 [Brachyspira intermedia]|uniref:hypothetical protein n=1 Tax=Brachyspira TaxID=29521 RepID=UPI003007086F
MNERILYENHRLQSLQLIINQCNNNPKLWERYKAFAYALNNRIYPFLDIDNGSIFDEFDDSVYTGCNKSDSDNFLKYFNDKELENNLEDLTFYKIEKALGGRDKRFSIINFLSYCKLHNHFIKLFPNLNNNKEAPIEAHGLMKDIDFNINDIKLFNIMSEYDLN